MNRDRKPVAVATGELYAFVWDQFDRRQWEKFSDDHFKRWSSLPVGDDFFRGKVVLDAGCGSGRAVRGFLLGGAARVCAIDAGEGCVRNTVQRNAGFENRLEVRQASVLDIPYPDDFFDVVHCDGVLHHTTDPRGGFRELVRVLKPGGAMIMAVYGRGGLMNFAIYSARLFRHVIPLRLTFALCRVFSRNPVVWYAVLDCMYVPIRENYHDSDIRKWFEAAQMTDVRRLDSTWGPYGHGRWMRGDGYLKFTARKT